MRNSFNSPARPWFRAAGLLLILLVTATTGLGSLEASAPAPRLAPVVALPPAPDWRDSLVLLARAQIGRTYVWGGDSPDDGFDCSGLVRFVLAGLAFDLPRTAAEQATIGEALPADTAIWVPGDLLVFGRDSTAHVGIYVGEGRMVHASSDAGQVVETEALRAEHPRIHPWRGTRRVDSAWRSTAPYLATENTVDDRRGANENQGS